MYGVITAMDGLGDHGNEYFSHQTMNIHLFSTTTNFDRLGYFSCRFGLYETSRISSEIRNVRSVLLLCVVLARSSRRIRDFDNSSWFEESSFSKTPPCFLDHHLDQRQRTAPVRVFGKPSFMFMTRLVHMVTRMLGMHCDTTQSL